MRVVSFVAASSNSGKTTLIERIVALFKDRGLRVAVIKHASAGFELDKPGKDSWRFQQAGADTVILAGPGKLAVMKHLLSDPSPDELACLAGDVDVIIHEGFKRQDAANRIEIFRSGVSGDRPISLESSGFLALVSDRPFNAGIPWFDWNDVEGIADFILRNIPPHLRH